MERDIEVELEEQRENCQFAERWLVYVGGATEPDSASGWNDDPDSL